MAKIVQRSRAYPSINLQAAVERAAVLFEREGRHPMHPDVAIEHWGLSPLSSPGTRSLAALRHYGLIESQGVKDDRRIRLTDLGLRLAVPDADPKERMIALQEAALTPDLFREIWEDKGGSQTSDANLRRTLLLEGELNKNVVDEVIACFRATIEFAGLSGNSNLSGIDENKTGDKGDSKQSNDSTPPSPKDPKGSNPMPTTNLEGHRDLDLPIPLIEGGQATLRIPVPLTTEDYEYLVDMLSSMLKGMRKALTRKEATGEPTDE